jgi:hypothetical protein
VYAGRRSLSTEAQLARATSRAGKMTFTVRVMLAKSKHLLKHITKMQHHFSELLFLPGLRVLAAFFDLVSLEFWTKT